MDIALDMQAGTYRVDQAQGRLVDGSGNDGTFAALGVHHHLDIALTGDAFAQAAADAEAFADDPLQRMDHCAGFAGCGATCWWMLW